MYKEYYYFYHYYTNLFVFSILYFKFIYIYKLKKNKIYKYNNSYIKTIIIVIIIIFFFTFSEDIYEITNIADRMNLRFKNDEDDIAIIAKENLLIKPFHGIPNSEYPSPWLTVNYREFGALIKACAYVLKKKYDLYPNSRVGIIANFTPINHMLIYALWYNRCSVVQIPVKLGNEVKQFWTRILNLKMIFYDVNFTPFDDEESIRMMKEQDEWIWKWQHPLTENEMDLEAGKEGILAVNLYGENFRNEILEAKNQGKSFERKCYDTDVIYIIGTSSSSQAIIKNGHC